MRKANSQGLLSGNKVCRGAPIISYLIFVDDCILFYRATQEEVISLRGVLDTYERVSDTCFPNTTSQVYEGSYSKSKCPIKLSNP
ncbi:hypothetical protein ACS0TY_034951 [Phlomoides rotata]